MKEIDLINMIKYFIKRIYLIIFVVLISASIGFLISNKKVSIPNEVSKYTGNIIILLNNIEDKIKIEDDEFKISHQNLNEIFFEIVKSKDSVDKVIKKLDLDYSYFELNSNITTKTMNNNEAIKISVTTENEEESILIAKELYYIFSNVVEENYDIKVGSTFISSSKVEPKEKVEENSQPKIILLSMIGGLVIIFLILFIRYNLYLSIEDVDDYDKLLGMVVKRNKNKFIKNNKTLESIKIIKSRLEPQLKKNKIKTVLITSSVKGEGKSFITHALAREFSKLGQKVLIIDGDIQYKNKSKENIKGITNILYEDVNSYHKFIKKTKFNNISLLPVGNRKVDICECKIFNKLKDLFNLLSKNYDLILVDSSSLNQSSDSLEFSKVVDGIIIICCIDRTSPKMLKSTNKILNNYEEKIIGLIVNNADNYL